MSSFRTYLQAPKAADEKPFLAAMRDSVGLHHPWISAPKDHKGWQRYMNRLEQKTEAGFLVKRLGDGAICGVVNLNIITLMRCAVPTRVILEWLDWLEKAI